MITYYAFETHMYEPDGVYGTYIIAVTHDGMDEIGTSIFIKKSMVDQMTPKMLTYICDRAAYSINKRLEERRGPTQS